MKTKINNAKAFATKHKTALTFAAGIGTGAGVAYAIVTHQTIDKSTLALLLTDAQFEEVKDGGVAVFNTMRGTIAVVKEIHTPS